MAEQIYFYEKVLKYLLINIRDSVVVSDLLQEWDDELALVAQGHADQCIFEHECSDCRRVCKYCFALCHRGSIHSFACLFISLD